MSPDRRINYSNSSQDFLRYEVCGWNCFCNRTIGFFLNSSERAVMRLRICICCTFSMLEPWVFEFIRVILYMLEFKMRHNVSSLQVELKSDQCVVDIEYKTSWFGCFSFFSTQTGQGAEGEAVRLPRCHLRGVCHWGHQPNSSWDVSVSPITPYSHIICSTLPNQQPVFSQPG